MQEKLNDKLMVDIFFIGHILEETIVYPDGDRTSTVLGGPAAYASVASSCLGYSAGLITKVNHNFKNSFLPTLMHSGIDMNGIQFGSVGTKNFLHYEDNGGKELHFVSQAPPLEWDDIPLEYRKARYCMICPINYEVSLPMIQKLHNTNKTILVDMGGFGGASSQRGFLPKDERIRFAGEVARYVDILKFSTDDCYYLFEKSMDNNEYIQKIEQLGCKNFVLTIGEKGCIVKCGTQQKLIPAYKTKAVDVTGAGDVWGASFLSMYSRSQDMFESAEYASAAASILVEKRGGVTLERMPRHSAVMSRMKGGQ